jgi:hypothetical protein
MTTKPELRRHLKDFYMQKKKLEWVRELSKQGIGKTKQQGNKNEWKPQTPLNINTECKWPQWPS